MSSQLYINLPVADLQKSIVYFTNLGYSFNPMFTDETATCMIVSETINIMLLTKEKLSEYTSRPIADASKTTEVTLALSLGSKEEVNSLAQKAIENGAIEVLEAKDFGFMYQRTISDLDHHLWEYFYLDLNSYPKKEGINNESK